jgi:hypothetical protein
MLPVTYTREALETSRIFDLRTVLGRPACEHRAESASGSLLRLRFPHLVDELLNLILLFVGRVRFALPQLLENRKLLLRTGLISLPR